MRRVFLCRRTVRGSLSSELSEKLKEGERSLGLKTGERGTDRKLVGDQNPDPEAPPRSKKGQERRKQRRCQERSNVEGWMCRGH